MNAFKDGVTVLNEDNLNEMVSLQPFTLIYEGTVDDSMSDAGVTELAPADYNYAIMFKTGAGITELTRLELDVATDGTGQDLTILIKGNNFNPDGSNEGTTLRTIVIPKEFLPASQAYFKIPIYLTGLTAATTYWIIVSKVGDATNHNHIYSKGSQKDVNHKTYRRSGASGAWSDISDSVRFACYQGVAGVPFHEIYGTNGYTTILYTSGQPTTIYFYMPPSDTSVGGIRDTMTLAYSGGILTGGSVT